MAPQIEHDCDTSLVRSRINKSLIDRATGHDTGLFDRATGRVTYDDRCDHSRLCLCVENMSLLDIEIF